MQIKNEDNMDLSNMSYADLEAEYNGGNQEDILDDESTPLDDDENKDDEDLTSGSENDENADSDTADDEANSDDPPEDGEKMTWEELNAELRKRDNIILNQKKQIDKQSQEVGVSRKIRNNIPGLTEEEKLLIQNAEIDDGFLGAQEKFDEIIRKKQEAAEAEIFNNLQKNEATLIALCPDFDQYTDEIRKILVEDGIPAENIENALTYKGTSNPYEMAQVYKRAKYRKGTGSKLTELEDLRIKNQELEKALREGNINYLKKLEKAANTPTGLKSGTNGSAGRSKPKVDDSFDVTELSYDDLQSQLD